ncbi:MAG TPA: hypothetical protein VFE18_12725, partial [Phenylobacterium sp.]|uniref:hypothetical protein n=1 Tax=Phenylobacterium sp. TaxID=1871053 RepID=UPI002D4F1B5F
DSTLDPRSLQGAYALTNLRIGIGPASGAWKLSVFGKNLGDKAYYVATAAQPLGGLVSAGGTAAAGGFFGWYGTPRTYGIELTVRR